MIPRKSEKISLLKLSVRDKKWVVKGQMPVVIETVEVLNNSKVRLLTTINGRSYFCERLFSPMTLEELGAAVWQPTIARRVGAGPDLLFVEAVIAFNVHRQLGMKHNELVCDNAVRTSVVPHTYNGYCATHDRVHYWSANCPKCTTVAESSIKEEQAA